MSLNNLIKFVTIPNNVLARRFKTSRLILEDL